MDQYSREYAIVDNSLNAIRYEPETLEELSKPQNQNSLLSRFASKKRNRELFGNAQPRTLLNLNMGRYIDTNITPTNRPMTTMIKGSIRVDSNLDFCSTSWVYC